MEDERTSDAWFSLGSPLTGTVVGHARVADAVVLAQSRLHAGTDRPVSGELVTATLNLATGLGASQRVKNNARIECNGSTAPRWECMTEHVATVVAADLRRAVPEDGNADPAVVLMTQEARPLLVDAIAREVAAHFARDISTLFVAQATDATVANAEQPRAQYGNALLATVPLEPAVAMNFTHEPENRMFVAATMLVAGTRVTVGTYHAQLDVPGREGQQADERRALELLAASLPTPVVIGGDFNNRAFRLTGFTTYTSRRARVDGFAVRGTRPMRLGRRAVRRLRATPYDLDHPRVARRWRV